MSGPAPYAGLKVVELAETVAGEALGRMLAEMGAAVTKVEDEAGGSPTRAVGPFAGHQVDPEASLTFWYYNGNKTSVAAPYAPGLDAALAPLLEEADLMIVTFPPTRLKALDIDLDALAARFPRLIIASVTPYGLTGPWADYATSNLVAIAGGPLFMCGYDDHSIPPINPGGDQAHHTVAIFAHVGLLVALLDRQRTGLGQVLDVSMHSANALNTELGNPFWFYNGVNVMRQTCRHAQPVPTQSAMFACADGSYVYYTLILADQHSWKILVDWMDEMGVAAMLTEPEYSEILFRQQHMGEIQDLVECFFLIQDGHQAYLEGQKRGLPIGIVNAPEELLEDEHLVQRGFFVPVDTGPEHGDVLHPGDSFRFSAFGSVPRTRAPHLGEHGRLATPDTRSDQ